MWGVEMFEIRIQGQSRTAHETNEQQTLSKVAKL